VQASLGSHPEEYAVQAADVAIFKQFQLEALERCQTVRVCSCSKDTSGVFGMHLRRHGSEGDYPLDAQLPGIVNQLPAESILAERRLGLPQKDDNVALLLRIFPHEEAVAWSAAGLDEAFFHLHVIHVEKVIGLVLGNHLHVE